MSIAMEYQWITVVTNFIVLVPGPAIVYPTGSNHHGTQI